MPIVPLVRISLLGEKLLRPLGLQVLSGFAGHSQGFAELADFGLQALIATGCLREFRFKPRDSLGLDGTLRTDSRELRRHGDIDRS